MTKATKPLLNPEERENWLLFRLHESQVARLRGYKSSDNRWPITCVDVLDQDFVDSFVEATGVSVQIKMLGANYCRTLGADLLSLYKQGLLERWRTGVQAPTGGGGWPTWVWSYYIPEGAMKSIKKRLEKRNESTV